jgi:uncharacterized membrane protein YdbT with pleckstrin-like domain
MAYYSKVLLPDEQVRYVGRIHWAIYLRGWVLLLIALAAGIEASTLPSESNVVGQVPTADIALAIAGIFLFFGLISLLSAWGRRITTEIVVTDKRVIYKVGFIRRRTMEMNMSKVETVDVVQSIPGRMLNYGTVMIRGVGSSYEPLYLIGGPLELRTAIVAG